MNKIVVLKCSPRTNGNTARMADAFTAAAQNNGSQILSFNVAQKMIAGCSACNLCAEAGECVYQDDFQEITSAILDADGLVIASPVYWFSFPSQIKALIDRWYSLCNTGTDFYGKKTALISACEEPEIECFTGIRYAYEKTMEYMKAISVGEVLIPGVFAAEDIEKTDGLSKAAALADLFRWNEQEPNNISEQLSETDADKEPEAPSSPAEYAVNDQSVLPAARIRSAAERWICKNRIYVVPEEDGPECYVIGPDLEDWLEYDIMDLWDNLDWNGEAYQAINADDLLDTIKSWREIYS